MFNFSFSVFKSDAVVTISAFSAAVNLIAAEENRVEMTEIIVTV